MVLRKSLSIVMITWFTLALSACQDKIFLRQDPPIKDFDLCRRADEIRNLATGWLKNNFSPSGLWHYLYMPDKDVYARSNNAIRQLMASRLAAQLAFQDRRFLQLHRLNIQFVLSHWYREKNAVAYVYFNGKSKLGANAMLLRTLVASPFFQAYEQQARRLADGIVFLMNEKGGFRPFFVEPDYAYDADYLLTFYSGEAILSLVDYYLKTGNGYYLQKAVRAQNFYLQKYVTHLKKNYYPAYVPWHTQSLSRLYQITGNPEYARAILILNDELIKIQDKKEYVGRFYNPDFPRYGTPHASSDAVYTESLAYACEVAGMLNDRPRKKIYLEALQAAVSNLQTLQFRRAEIVRKKYDFLKTNGALRIRVGDDRIRVDNVQHTVDALLKVEQICRWRLSVKTGN